MLDRTLVAPDRIFPINAYRNNDTIHAMIFPANSDTTQQAP